MKKLPDSSFFGQEPFAGGAGGETQSDAESTFGLGESEEKGAFFKDGLGADFSKAAVPTAVGQTGDFKFMNRTHINQLCLLLSVFGIDLLENGHLNLAFRSDVSDLTDGYPKGCILPLVAEEESSGPNRMAFVSSKTDDKTDAPASMDDSGWNRLTPTFADLGKFSQGAIVYYSSWSAMSAALKQYEGKTYHKDVMTKVYACRHYSSSGMGMNKYGAMFGWGWDGKKYRLFRIKQVFFNGNEMVEVHSGRNVVFCRYFNGTDCKIVESRTGGSGSVALLCGQYKVEVGGGGGGGSVFYHH